MGKQAKRRGDPFEKITWEVLEGWAGKKIVSRGQNYQKRGEVEDLGKLEEGDIIARVHGTERYVTRVTLKGEKLDSECTCPYESDCKHAVAVILEYIDCLKNGKSIDFIKNKKNDNRIKELEDYNDWDEDEDAWFDEEEDDDFDFHEKTPFKKKCGGSKSEVEKFLNAKTKKELILLCQEMTELIPEAKQLILDKHALSSGKHTKIIAAIRSELVGLQDTQWDRHGFGGHSADLVRLKKHVNALVELEKFDELIALGSEILEAGSRAVEHEHEGESSEDISDCLEVIFGIVPRSSLEPVEQLSWAIDMELEDEYSLCDGLASSFWEKKQSKKTWSLLADKLYERLASLEAPKNRSDFSKCYYRDKMSNWVALALEKAGRKSEVISLYIAEATATHSYDRLVAYLVELKKWNEAKKYCFEGIKALQSQTNGHPGRLYDQLEAIYKSTKNDSQMAALIADDFFSSPDLASFKKLLQVGKRLKKLKIIDAWARHFLETGIEPSKTLSRKTKEAPQEAWPLEKPESPLRERRNSKSGPRISVLIEIAISEKKPHEVVKWYDAKPSKQSGSFFNPWVSSDEQVAEAIKSEYPERAIQIWKRIAQGNINQVSPKGYDAAAPFLKKIKSLMKKKKMNAEWDGYMATLRQQNQRRPRCMQVLNRVAQAGKPIVKTT